MSIEISNTAADYSANKVLGSIYPISVTRGLRAIYTFGGTLANSIVNKKTRVSATVTGTPTVDANSLTLTGNANWLLTDVPQTSDFTIVAVATADPAANTSAGSFILAATQNSVANQPQGISFSQSATSDNLSIAVQHYDGAAGAASHTVNNGSLSYATAVATDFEFHAVRGDSTAKATKLYRRSKGVNTSIVGAWSPGTDVRDLRTGGNISLGSYAVSSSAFAGSRKVALVAIYDTVLTDFEIDRAHSDLIAAMAPRGITTL